MFDFIIRGRLIDGASDTAVEDGLVAVEGERIAYAGPAALCPKDALAAAKTAGAVTLQADTILPGFIDCHAHLTGEEDAGDYADGKFFGDQLMGAAYQTGLLLDSGFTGLRDMSEAGVFLSRAQARGILRAPRIVPGARILGTTSGHVDLCPDRPKAYANAVDHLSRLCDGVDDCILAVREQFRLGARFIKICATGGVSSPTDRVDDVQFSPAELRAIVEETERHHTYVTAHCTGNEGAYQALLAGVRCIEHGVMLTQREIDLMAEKHVPLVSTLAVSLGVARMTGFPSWMHEKALAAAECNLRTIEMDRKAGIMICFGTDYSNSRNTPYRGIGREFEAMTEAGMTNMEAIQAGTSHAAHLMMNEQNVGTLEAGKLADLVLVDGNPLEDIRCLTDADHIKTVLLGGKVVKQTA